MNSHHILKERHYLLTNIYSVGIILSFLLTYLLSFAFIVLGIYLLGLLFTVLLSNLNILRFLGAIYVGQVFAIFCMFFLHYLSFLYFRIPKSSNLEEDFKYTLSKESELYKLICSIADELKIARPQNVYIEYTSNAFYSRKSIFGKYDLGFGLPLFYGLNKTELKGVIYHELMHHRFRSNFIILTGKLGVRIEAWVNKISYYEELVNGLEKNFLFSTLFTHMHFFSNLYKKMNLYFSDNLFYKNLCVKRYFEFLVDFKVAEKFGWESVRDFFVKSDFLGSLLDKFKHFYFNELEEEKVLSNFSEFYEFLIGFYVNEAGYKYENFLIDVDFYDYYKFYNSKVNFINESKSHPNIFLRVENIKNVVGTEDYDETPSISLVKNDLKLIDTEFSNFINRIKTYSQELDFCDLVSFDQIVNLFKTCFVNNNYNKVYKRYYDYFYLDIVNEDVDCDIPDDIEELFESNLFDSVLEYLHLIMDVDLLLKLKYGNYKKPFLYEGNLYWGYQIDDLLSKIEEQREVLSLDKKKFDAAIFKFFENKSRLLNRYNDWDLKVVSLLEFRDLKEEILEIEKEYRVLFKNFINEKSPHLEKEKIEEVHDFELHLKAVLEKFKNHYLFDHKVTYLDEFLSSNRTYYKYGVGYYNNEIDKTFDLLNNLEKYFDFVNHKLQKDLLDLQVEFL